MVVEPYERKAPERRVEEEPARAPEKRPRSDDTVAYDPFRREQERRAEPWRQAERLPPQQSVRPVSPYTERMFERTTAARQAPSPGRPAPDSARAAPRPAAPARAPGVAARAPVTVRRLRKGRLAIRKVDPWAVLKFSLVFYFCMTLIGLLVVGIVFAALRIFGVIDNFEKLLRSVELDVSIGGAGMFRWMFLIGIGWTIVASAITTFMAFLYNLISDVVGGIEVLVAERES